MKRSAATAIIILWIMVQWVSVTFAAESQLPAGFVYLSEVAPDIRVELRYCTSGAVNFSSPIKPICKTNKPSSTAVLAAYPARA